MFTNIRRGRLGQRIALAAVLACTTSGLAACGSSTGTSPNESGSASGIEKKTIGYVDLIASGAMQRRYFDYFSEGAKAVGWEVQLQDAKGDPTRANTAAINLLNQGVDALVVSCADSAPMAPAIRLAKTKKIPAVQVGCAMTDEGAWDASFPIDDAAVGKTLGEHVVKELGADAKVGILGDTTILAGKVRGDGLQQGFSSGSVNVVGNQSVSLTDAVGATRKTASSYLTANPDLKGIIAVYDFFAPPAGETVQNANRTADVGVYSFFADAVNVPYMKTPNSALRAVADGPVEQVSLVAVDQLLAHFEEGKAFDSSAAKNLDISYEIFTKDNLPEGGDDYLTPYPVEKYLSEYKSQWDQKYGSK